MLTRLAHELNNRSLKSDGLNRCNPAGNSIGTFRRYWHLLPEDVSCRSSTSEGSLFRCSIARQTLSEVSERIAERCFGWK